MSEQDSYSELVQALRAQTQAMEELAASNRELVAVIADLLAEREDSDEVEPKTYLDGTPK